MEEYEETMKKLGLEPEDMVVLEVPQKWIEY